MTRNHLTVLLGIILAVTVSFTSCSNADIPATTGEIPVEDEDGLDGLAGNPMQFGDFEMVWTYNGKEIGKGILHAVLDRYSTFGMSMDSENNMTNFFVDICYDKDFQTMEPQKVTFDIDDYYIYNAYLKWSFTGYSSDTYSYNINNLSYQAVAKIDGRLYQFQPIPDYEKSTMTYDPREKVWKGVIMIIQIDFGEINDDASSTPQMEKYILSPMLKIEFNTTKRIK